MTRLLATSLLLSLLLGTPAAIFADTPAPAEVDAVEVAIDEVSKLPGYELREVYLSQMLEDREWSPDDAARLRGALEVLRALAESGHVERARLSALLRLGASGDPALAEAAVHSARTGGQIPIPNGRQPESGPSTRAVARDWLDDVDSGVGPIAWKADRYEVIRQLGNELTWHSINEWDGPKYALEAGYLEFISSIAGCRGDFYFFFDNRGFSRFWFSAEDPKCWLPLTEYLKARRGSPRSETVESEVVSARILEWEGRVPIKVAAEGVEQTTIFVSVEAPSSSHETGSTSADDSYNEADYWASRETAKTRDRRERGERLRRRSIAPGTTGIILLVTSAGAGLGIIDASQRTDTGAIYVLAGVSIVSGLLGGTLATIAVAQDTHGRILIRRADAQARGSSPSLEVSVGLSAVSLNLRW